MIVELKDETDELAIICAALGRIKDGIGFRLYDRLRAELTASQLVYFHELSETLEFSPTNPENVRMWKKLNETGKRAHRGPS